MKFCRATAGGWIEIHITDAAEMTGGELLRRCDGEREAQFQHSASVGSAREGAQRDLARMAVVDAGEL